MPDYTVSFELTQRVTSPPVGRFRMEEAVIHGRTDT